MRPAKGGSGIGLEDLRVEHPRHSAPVGSTPETAYAPSQSLRTFLANYARDLVSLDFFTGPTARLPG